MCTHIIIPNHSIGPLNINIWKPPPIILDFQPPVSLGYCLPYNSGWPCPASIEVTSLNQIDHIMTFHDMSSNVTMLN